jgi:hypothetical protein
MKEENKDGLSRRKFMQAGGLIAAAAAIPKQLKASTNEITGSAVSPEEDFLQYIDPTIGNIAPLLNTNRPVVHLPNQMVRTHPRRQDYLDDQITGFPLLSLNVITHKLFFQFARQKAVWTIRRGTIV